jgi:two-component system, chemotaxis family, protein-glutamate methylesterase/glutaminase
VRRDGPIRVLIVDDTAPFVRALASELDRWGDLHTFTSDGKPEHMRDQLMRYHPEFILLDLALRTQNAIELLGELHANYPVPVIVSARNDAAGATHAAAALHRGALEVVCRPSNIRTEVLQPYARDLARKIRAAVSLARPVPLPAGATGRPTSFGEAGVDPRRYLVALGASTGGTRAIEVLLGQVPADFPALVIVQHMPAGFTQSFAARLNSRSAMAVTEAVDGETLGPGRAVVARGDTHLVVRPAASGWRVQYTDQRPVNRHCPSVDVLFESVATIGRQRAVGLLLTGMGSDGARGLLQMRQAGALTIAQSAESCVVYGMPKVAIELGAAMYTTAPHEMPGLVLRSLRTRVEAR